MVGHHRKGKSRRRSTLTSERARECQRLPAIARHYKKMSTENANGFKSCPLSDVERVEVDEFFSRQLDQQGEGANTFTFPPHNDLREPASNRHAFSQQSLTPAMMQVNRLNSAKDQQNNNNAGQRLPLQQTTDSPNVVDMLPNDDSTNNHDKKKKKKNGDDDDDAGGDDDDAGKNGNNGDYATHPSTLPITPQEPNNLDLAPYTQMYASISSRNAFSLGSSDINNPNYNRFLALNKLIDPNPPLPDSAVLPDIDVQRQTIQPPNIHNDVSAPTQAVNHNNFQNRIIASDVNNNNPQNSADSITQHNNLASLINKNNNLNVNQNSGQMDNNTNQHYYAPRIAAAPTTTTDNTNQYYNNPNVVIGSSNNNNSQHYINNNNNNPGLQTTHINHAHNNSQIMHTSVIGGNPTLVTNMNNVNGNHPQQINCLNPQPSFNTGLMAPDMLGLNRNNNIGRGAVNQQNPPVQYLPSTVVFNNNNNVGVTNHVVQQINTPTGPVVLIPSGPVYNESQLLPTCNPINTNNHNTTRIPHITSFLSLPPHGSGLPTSFLSSLAVDTGSTAANMGSPPNMPLRSPQLHNPPHLTHNNNNNIHSAVSSRRALALQWACAKDNNNNNNNGSMHPTQPPVAMNQQHQQLASAPHNVQQQGRHIDFNLGSMQQQQQQQQQHIRQSGHYNPNILNSIPVDLSQVRYSTQYYAHNPRLQQEQQAPVVATLRQTVVHDDDDDDKNQDDRTLSC